MNGIRSVKLVPAGPGGGVTRLVSVRVSPASHVAPVAGMLRPPYDKEVGDAQEQRVVVVDGGRMA